METACTLQYVLNMAGGRSMRYTRRTLGKRDSRQEEKQPNANSRKSMKVFLVEENRKKTSAKVTSTRMIKRRTFHSLHSANLDGPSSLRNIPHPPTTPAALVTVRGLTTCPPTPSLLFLPAKANRETFPDGKEKVVH
ncbi:hypothetical protein CDAR_535891 [Caerostris darwini]|uniref:Uncharacterized protein n=1 Tax=Caerostris darwini TaxID=1538125 RepID=A0AAV4QUP0_9ARAC|nr:hypothetical protein CDAR_535891 [Caerostris darwini]